MIENEEGAIQWLYDTLGVDEETISRIEEFNCLLAEENGRQNLVAATSIKEIWVRHILDSAQLLVHVPRETPLCWLDLGTGAGFPGLIVAILAPNISVTMVESRCRRVECLERVCASLNIANAKVAGMQLDRLEMTSVDVISARAFAPLDALLTMAQRFSTSETIWLLPKGRSAAQELTALRGWEHMFHVEPSLTNADSGIVE